MLDVDHFKTINDRFGHAVGDQVLVRLASTINSAIRNEDLACRYGGEEFLLLIPRLDMEKTMAIADRVRKAVEEMAVDVQDEAVKITISAGVASLQSTDGTLEALIERADHTLLKAKASGRNMVLPAE
jgi:diguanylate cyclase (GGDEF)-like protein